MLLSPPADATSLDASFQGTPGGQGEGDGLNAIHRGLNYCPIYMLGPMVRLYALGYSFHTFPNLLKNL